jgi:hypothetical protein
MKNLKKTMRLLGLFLLIVLASIGIGISGGVPISPSNKREDAFEIKIELVESNEDETLDTAFDIKS